VAIGVLDPIGEMGVDEGEVRAFEHAFFVVRRFRARLVIAEVGDHESLGRAQPIAEGIEPVLALPSSTVMIQREGLDLPSVNSNRLADPSVEKSSRRRVRAARTSSGT
jgi:hypothetical protein